jgi:hypothetical protein
MRGLVDRTGPRRPEPADGSQRVSALTLDFFPNGCLRAWGVLAQPTVAVHGKSHMRDSLRLHH